MKITNSVALRKGVSFVLCGFLLFACLKLGVICLKLYVCCFFTFYNSIILRVICLVC